MFAYMPRPSLTMASATIEAVCHTTSSVVDPIVPASMRQNVQVSRPVGTRADLEPLSLSRPTLAMIVSLRLRKASFLAYSPHALANDASPSPAAEASSK